MEDLTGDSSQFPTGDLNQYNEIVNRVTYLAKIFYETKTMMPSFTGEFTTYDSLRFNIETSNTSNSCIYVQDFNSLSLYNTILKDENKKSLLVHSACATNRGGGAKEGYDTVEAELCRRTNYWKALRNIEHNYPLSNGTVNYITDVITFRSIEYKKLKSPYNIDICSIVIPNSPSYYFDNNIEKYERQRDYDVTLKTLEYVFYLAKNKGYDNIIFDNVGIGKDRHPVHGFIECMKQATSIIQDVEIYYLIPRGTTRGEGKYQRRNWITVTNELDNSGIDLTDQEPPEDESELTQRFTRKSKKSELSQKANDGISDSDNDSN